MTRIPATRWAGAVTALAVVAATVAVAAKKRSDPSVAWLDGRGPARWIVYPSPGDTGARAIVELEASFERSLRLDAAPTSAVLRLRAFRSGVVRINGREAAVVAGPGWKAERTAAVPHLLRAGENLIEVSVANAAGPPALWLALELPGATLVSDERWTSSWAGASPRPAALASAPRPGRMQDPDRRVPSSIAALGLERSRLVAFAVLALAGAGAIALLRRRRRGWPIWSPRSPWPLGLALGTAALLWVFLFVNDSPWLPLSLGFDASAHLEYAQFILDRRALPFADDGWQMFQPPLYYLLLAAGFASTGVSPGGPGAAVVVRGVGLAVGLAHLALLAACMRLVFPERPLRQVVGLAFGAFLPCMLYLHQYPANEPLVAMLSSGAILVTLRLVRRDEPRPGGHAALGVLLGLAMLAKVSALLLLPPLLGALAARALLGGRPWRARRLAGTALAAATLLAVCGWYYARVWQRFGTPFVGGWDARRGMGWWADPGYRTVDDFLRFGRAFTAPLFAGFDGVWDGLYVTFFGDGLLSGRGGVALVPPWWSPSLMSAALALAALPAVAILAGALAALVRWIRQPDATTGVLVSIGLLVLLSLLSMAVAVPSIAAAKASYGLLGLVPLCAFGAHAVGVAADGRWRAPLLASAVAVWAATSFATYWIDGASGKARLLQGTAEIERGDGAGGLALVREGHARDPGGWPERIVLAGYLLQTGGPRERIVELLAPGAQVPGLAVRHVALAGLAIRDGDPARAEASLGDALAADPDNLHAHLQLASLRASAGDLPAAVKELREALRIDPQQRASHLALSDLYARLGDPQRAAMHREYAARLDAAR